MEEGEVEEASKEECGGVWVVGAVNEEKGEVASPPGLPMRRTLEAFMPRKTEVKNKFKIFQMSEEDMDDEEEIGSVDEQKEGEVNEVVEITVDSGASRSVWPRKKKGVTRSKLVGKKPRLQAANGTNIEVDGEAMLEFQMGGKKCGMKFLDADVKKPLGAVSAMEDEGNTVVFSRKWGSYVENDKTGERIPMERKGGVYVMVLNAMDSKGNKVKKRGEVEEMEVDGLSEEEEVGRGGEKVVFRRQMRQ
jgi:hypothetical protein